MLRVSASSFSIETPEAVDIVHMDAQNHELEAERA